MRNFKIMFSAMLQLFLIVPLLLLLLKSSDALVTGPTFMRYCFHSRSAPTMSMSVESASVESINDDHESEGLRMAASIAQYLDQEWMPQEVHIKMADCAKETYVKCREDGETDIMSIMMSVSENLEKRWNEFDDDAFVSAWDVGNYVADYLTDRAGIQGCECSAKVVTPVGYE